MRIHYIYIYLPRPYRPRGVDGSSVPPEIGEALDRMVSRAGGAHMPPEIKAKLDKIRGLTGRILGIIEGIKSPGLQTMLKQMLQNILAKAEGGNLDGAIQDLNTLVNTCERISDKLRKAQGMCSALSTNTIPGPAGALLQAIGKVALEALAACDSEQKLDEISILLERSMELMSQLGILKPTDDKYIDICKELKGILAKLSSMEREDPNGGGPGMGGDQLVLAATMKEQVAEALEGLKGRALPPGEAEQIEALRAKLLELAELASKAGHAGAKRQLHEVLHLVGQGKVTEALRGATEATEALVVLSRRKAYGEGLLERLGEVKARLASAKGAEGRSGHPSARMVDAVHQALTKALAEAQSVEELAALEAQLRVVLQAARTLEAGVGGLEGAHAAQELLKVASALGVARVGGQEEAPPPGWQPDSWGSSISLPPEGGSPSAAPGGPAPGSGLGWGGPSAGSPAGVPPAGSGPSGLGWGGPSAGAAPEASAGASAPSGLGWGGASAGGPAGHPEVPSSSDPMGHLQVPAVLSSIQSEGQRVGARCWGLGSAMEGSLHDPAAQALASLTRRLGASTREEEALELLQGLRAMEAALEAVQQARQGSPEAEAARAQLQALLAQPSGA